MPACYSSWHRRLGHNMVVVPNVLPAALDRVTRRTDVRIVSSWGAWPRLSEKLSMAEKGD